MAESEVINQPKEQQPRGQPAGVNVQMPPSQQPNIWSGNWSSGLFSCCSDCCTFCSTFWCPCVTFGQIAEIADEGKLYTQCFDHGSTYALCICCGYMPCLYSHLSRGKIRSKYGIPPGPYGDFCTHFWCECCALHQEYRELQHRGFDPSLGWEGNKRAQTLKKTAAPTPPGGMKK